MFGTVLRNLGVVLISLCCATICIFATDDNLRADIKNHWARVDFFNAGSSQNTFEVVQKDKHVYLEYPEWLARENGFGGVLKTKARFREKTQFITLKAVNDGDAYIDLRGEDVKNKPVRITYTSVKVNDKEQLDKPVTVWSGNSRKIEFNVLNGEEYEIVLTYHKANIWIDLLNVRTIIGFLFVFLLFFVGLRRYSKKCESYLIMKWNTVYSFLDGNVEEYIIQKWTNISVLSKKAFWWIFLIVNVVFLFHTVTFFWGNHDWALLKRNMGTSSDMLSLGRFTGGLIQQVFGGDLLPIANNLFCFAGFALAVVYLAKYWKLPKTPMVYILFGLFIVLMPYTVAWLWYIKQTSLFWNILFCVWALMLSEKYSLSKSIIAVFLMVISLGAYASIISTLAIMFLGRILIDYIYDEKNVKTLAKQYIYTVLNICLSVIVFKLILVCYDSLGKLKYGYYNTDYVTISELPNKLKEVFIAIGEMFYISQPFMSVQYKLLFLLPLVGVFLVSFRKKKMCFGLFLVSMILFCSQFTNLIAKANFSHFIRIDFFALPYIFALFVTICLKYNQRFRTLSFSFMIVVICHNIISDLRWQKVNYLGMKAEFSIHQDVIRRIKSSDNFSDRLYVFINAGENSRRKDFYHYNEYRNKGQELLEISFVPNWNEKIYYDFYESKSYISSAYTISRANRLPQENGVLLDISDFILNKARPYPHKNSVYVDGKYIYVIYSEQGLKDAQDNLRFALKERGLLND